MEKDELQKKIEILSATLIKNTSNKYYKDSFILKAINDWKQAITYNGQEIEFYSTLLAIVEDDEVFMTKIDSGDNDSLTLQTIDHIFFDAFTKAITIKFPRKKIVIDYMLNFKK